MLMGDTRHRWTLEEENSLSAGVDKYGTGKWKKILTDEDFAPCLVARTNIDLKDKWRNLCGNASRRAVSLRCSTDKEISSRYNARNLKALPSVNNSDGLDVVANHSYTEVKIEDEYKKMLEEVGGDESLEVECLRCALGERRGHTRGVGRKVKNVAPYNMSAPLRNIVDLNAFAHQLTQQLSQQFNQHMQQMFMSQKSKLPTSTTGSI